MAPEVLKEPVVSGLGVQGSAPTPSSSGASGNRTQHEAKLVNAGATPSYGRLAQEAARVANNRRNFYGRKRLPGRLPNLASGFYKNSFRNFLSDSSSSSDSDSDDGGAGRRRALHHRKAVEAEEHARNLKGASAAEVSSPSTPSCDDESDPVTPRNLGSCSALSESSAASSNGSMPSLGPIEGTALKECGVPDWVAKAKVHSAYKRASQAARDQEFSEYDTFSEVLGVCRYTKKQTVLALAPENTLVNLLNHRYVAEFQLAKTVRGVNPETHVRVLGDGDDKDSYKTFPEDTKLEISVDDMLKATGIDLDKTVDENVPNNGGSSERSAFLKAQQGAVGYKSGKYPRTRLTGAELTIRLKYYNHGFGPKSVRKGRLSNKVRCVAELEAAPRWTALGSQSTEYLVDSSSPHIFELNSRTQDTGNGNVVHTRMLLSKYKYGVRVNIQVLGLIGQFNYNYLLNTLVQALVFLGVINSIMTLIAQYCMGARSPIYTRAMREEVNFQKCIANFTTKMFVANEAFKSVDRNGDGSVSLAEVTDAIPRIFPEMSKRESATLAALLMSVSEKEKSATTSKKISANSIRGARLHKDDFVKIFAEIKPAWFTDVISKGAIRIEEDVMLLLGENDKDQEAGAIRDLGDVEVDVERRNRSASNASAILER